jgi:hypothetical protein
MVINNYGANKTKLMSCCRTMMIVFTIFSFLFGLSMVGTANVAAGSQTGGGGGQELEEEEQSQRAQICDSSGGGTDGTTNDNTTMGVDGAANNNTATASLYQNPEYGIQIQCPENWVYREEEDPFTGDFQVTFMSLRDAFEFGTAQESGSDLQLPPTLVILVKEPPFGITNVRQLEDFITSLLTSQGNQIVSTNPNATLSGMPALEVVAVEPENTTQTMQVWTIQGDRAYGAIYGSHESRFNQFLPIAQDTIRSFAITGEVGTTITNTPLTGDIDNGNATTVQGGGLQQQQQQEVEWLPYENATYGVRMLYPSTWIQEDVTLGDDARFISVSNFFSPEETDWAFVSIGIDNMPTNLQSSLNDTIKSYNENPSNRDFQVLSTTMNNFTLADMPAYTLEATYRDPEFGPRQVLVVETIVDNKGYSINYDAPSQTYQQYFPIVERMIESFEITQQLQQQENGQDEEGQQQQQLLQQPQQQQNQEDSFSAIPGLF